MALQTNKKPDMSVILGIGGKPKPAEAPPPYMGNETPDEENAEGGGMCSIMCPKCGEEIPLTVSADAGEMQPEEAPEEMEQAS